MAQREISRGYRGSHLGLVWSFVSPLLMVILLTVIFSKVLGFRYREVQGDSSLNYGLYLYCGLTPFLTYSQAVSQGMNVIRTNRNLVQGVVFPLEILPVSTVIASLIQSVFGIGALMVVLVVLEHRLYWTVLLLPLIFVPQLLFTVGLCNLTAIVGAYAPDVRASLTAVLQRVSFFITPIIWPVSKVPEHWRFLVDYNPLAVLVEAYRGLILEGKLPFGMHYGYFFLFSLALFVLGILLFNRVKHNFADLI
jgi:ABC-type polysaccharide/polyol phosphate export permease